MSNRYPLCCKLNFGLSISALSFIFLFTDSKSGAIQSITTNVNGESNPLGLCSAIPCLVCKSHLSNRWRFILNMFFFNCHFICCTVFRALLVTLKYTQVYHFTKLFLIPVYQLLPSFLHCLFREYSKCAT